MFSFLRKRNTRLFLGALLAALALFLAVRYWGQTPVGPVEPISPHVPGKFLSEGMELPAEVPLIPISGSAARIKDFGGKVLLINFWASWCGPCLHEMPGLIELQKRYQQKGFTVLGIAMDDDPSEGVRSLKAQIGEPPFPLFKGTETEIVDRFPIEGLPYTVIVDKNRKIQYARPGEVDWNEPEVRALIEKML